ncbi:Hypothetical predicted protein [Lecanosticta acicola]|uniref:Uncharacterized protein n=1 Tax=Lecanosticta acicola TaxID=111012 RepID=A0AAI8YW06_9PEZI|nr:Hypothetical predicted protein [Lecanosticta acicola]
MPPSRAQPHDPFTTSSSSVPPLRRQPSHPSLRSNASAASSRSRQRPAFLPRYTVGRTTPHIETTDVLEDADFSSERENEQVTLRQRPGPTRLRAKPSTHTTKPAHQHNPAEEEDIVNRGPNGSYFLDGSASFGMPAPTTGLGGGGEEEAQIQKAMETVRQEEALLARRYFTTGMHSRLQRPTRRHTDDDEDFEFNKLEMMASLREEAMQKIEDERWLYEAQDRYA